MRRQTVRKSRHTEAAEKNVLPVFLPDCLSLLCTFFSAFLDFTNDLLYYRRMRVVTD
jgi:hypothetical protein